VAEEKKPTPAKLTKPPQLLKFVQAPYPEAALKLQKESVVVMALDVDAEGIVQRVELIESGGRDFDSAAMAAAAGFEFIPAEAGELGPVPVRITYRYRFVFEPPPSKTTLTSSITQPTAPKPINFLGAIREAGSRLPLNLATITLVPTSTAGVRTSTESDARGRFKFRGIASGTYQVEVTAPFFTKLSVTENLSSTEVLEVAYFVRRRQKNPYEIVVRAEAPRKEVARRTIQLEEVQRIPGAQGDAIRVIQNFPGVARSPYGVGLLIVRGAPPQNTGVFLDGQRIPILFHFGGLGGITSVINASTLKEINFLPGGFGPEYGLVSAGAIELKTRPPKTDRVHGEAKLDMLTVIPANVSVMVEGPATDDPKDGAFIFSIRRSAIDGVFAAATEIFDVPAVLAPRYYDYSLRYDVPIGGDKKRSLTLFTYGSDDEIIVAGNAGGNSASLQSRTQFHRFNPRFTYRPDENTFFQVSPIIGIDKTESTAPPTEETEEFKLAAEAINAGLLVHGGTRLLPWLDFKAGGDVFYFDFEANLNLPGLNTITRFPTPAQGPPPTIRDSVRLPTMAASLFTEFEIRPIKGLTLWPGVRLQMLDYFAEQQLLVDPRLVEGRTLFVIDPRLTARYEPFDRLSLKAQIGQYSQPAFPQQVYLNADLPFSKSEQFSGGFDLDIIERLNLDIQGFYRYAYDIPQVSRDVQIINGALRPVGYRPTGLQRAYGMELFLRLENRWNWFGWIAYTLSRAEYRDWNGIWRRTFVFDQTHNLNAVAVYEFAYNWYAGLRFRYVTGGGLPNSTQRWYDADEDGYDRVISGNVRAPPFHQLDFYIEKRWIFEQWYLELYVDVQNVYNRTNTEVYTPSFDFKDNIPVPGLPILPSFGIKGVF